MDQKPLFPLATYALPVQKMAVKCMNPIDAVRYSLFSSTAAGIVKEAKVPFERIAIDNYVTSEGAREKQNLHFYFPGDYKYVVSFQERVRVGLKCPLQLISGEVLDGYVYSTEFQSHTAILVNEENKKTICNAFLNHMLTVFPTRGKETVEIHNGESLTLIPCLLQPNDKRTVKFMSLTGLWYRDQFRSVFDSVNVAETVSLTHLNNIQHVPLEKVVVRRIHLPATRLPTEQLVNVRSPIIELHDGNKEQFTFIVNKWASGEAFENLWMLEVMTDQAFIDDGSWREGINCEKWDPKRRPGYLCQFGDDNIETFASLRGAVDVIRHDGKFATILIAVNGDGVRSLHFRVWKEEEVKWTAEEDTAKMQQMLQKRTEEFDKSTDELRILENKIEELMRERRFCVEKIEKSELEMVIIRECLREIPD